MSFELKRDEALERLSKTGIWRSNYEPPLLRLLWRLGAKLPPPHFTPFLPTALVLGTWFAIVYGLLMWPLVWSKAGYSLPLAMASACGGGIAFGLAMAMYYSHGRRKHQLPAWATLGRVPGKFEDTVRIKHW